MIDFLKAYEKAKEYSGREDIDICFEDEKAFVFGKDKELSFGGELPVPILKQNEKAVSMLYYMDDIRRPDGTFLYTHRLIDGKWIKEDYTEES